ncbi:MAG: cytochrome c oxidase assembly protein [Actinobacteria bacterium]|nr:cytochrome c oxidase assembly protein [Actinomycetota bacterium]
MHASLEAVALVPLLAAGGIALRPRGLRLAALVAALALIFFAFATELQPLALHTFLWAHLLQNVVLAEWAPALLVLAVPPAAAARVRDFPGFRPLVGLPLWLGTYFAWHLPWVYDFALRRPHSLLHVEHVTYLLAGVCMWWPVVHGTRSAGFKAAYLFAAFVLASPLGLVLALFQRPIYSFYAHAPRTWGPSPLTDQRIAGVTMAGEQAVVLFAAFAAFMARFLQEEELAGAFDGLLDAQRVREPLRRG